MPYYKDLNILFIHIPKTGGTIIEKELRKLCDETLNTPNKPNNDLLPEPYNNVSLQHLFYNTLYDYREILKINFDDIKLFSFVRNPYNRIISDLLFFRLINTDTRPYQVYYKIINYWGRDDLDNHNIPQYKFITDNSGNIIPNIKIFNTENLNNDNDKINKYLNININIYQDTANKNYKKYLNKDSIRFINEKYSKDFELFNYKKIDPYEFEKRYKKPPCFGLMI